MSGRRRPRSRTRPRTWGRSSAFVLRLRGVTCLHASAAAVGDEAIAFVGDAGAGKSTTDRRAGSSRPARPDRRPARPGRGVRALPGAAGSPSRAALARLRRGALGRSRCAAPDRAHLGEALPRSEAAGIQLLRPTSAAGRDLRPRRSCSRAPTTPTIEPITGTDALIRLVANTYANYLLDNDMRAAELEVLGRLVNQVPVRLTRAPDDRSRISRVLRRDSPGLREHPPVAALRIASHVQHRRLRRDDRGSRAPEGVRAMLCAPRSSRAPSSSTSGRAPGSWRCWPAGTARGRSTPSSPRRPSASPARRRARTASPTGSSSCSAARPM